MKIVYELEGGESIVIDGVKGIDIRWDDDEEQVQEHEINSRSKRVRSFMGMERDEVKVTLSWKGKVIDEQYMGEK